MGKKSKRRNPTSSKNTNSSKIGQKKSSSTINGGTASGDKNNDDGINKWTIHDKKLAGSPNRRLGGGYTDDCDDELNEEFAAKVSFEDDDRAPKGSEEALDNALERTWYTDTSVSNPHNVGSAMGTEYEWMNWASYLANFPDQIATFWEEYDKDVKMHKYVLNKLSKEMSTKGDATEFIQALNCIFHDTFDRVRLEHPPLLNLERGMMIMNLNKMRGNFGQGRGGSERSLGRDTFFLFYF